MPAAKAFTIRKRQFPRLKEPRYEVDCGMVDGKRLRKFFRTREDANIFASEQKSTLRSQGERSVGLSEDDRVSFQHARDRHAAPGANIQRAVEFYLAHHRPWRKSLTLRCIFDKALLDKELAGKRPHYLSQFACSCHSFLRGREELRVTDIIREMVKA